MKVEFICYIEDKYVGEPEVKDEDLSHEFIIDWGTNPLPRKGDFIDFDELIEEWETNDKSDVFYDRTWEIEEIFWRYDKETKSYYPRYYLNKSEK